MSPIQKKYGINFPELLFKSWYGLLKPISETEYFYRLFSYLEQFYKVKKIWPQKHNIFRAFHLCDYHDLKIVILGLDPYPNSHANGLSFANSDETKSISPSLKKIIESIEDDYYNGLNLNFDITLESWAKQGVLLLNTALTVEEGKTGSHLNKWSRFTEFLIKRLSEFNPGTIYVLWGKVAQEYKQFIDQDNNYIIEGEHPSYSSYQGRKWNFSFKTIDEITIKLYGENIKW